MGSHFRAHHIFPPHHFFFFQILNGCHFESTGRGLLLFGTSAPSLNIFFTKFYFFPHQLLLLLDNGTCKLVSPILECKEMCMCILNLSSGSSLLMVLQCMFICNAH